MPKHHLTYPFLLRKLAFSSDLFARLMWGLVLGISHLTPSILAVYRTLTLHTHPLSDHHISAFPLSSFFLSLHMNFWQPLFGTFLAFYFLINQPFSAFCLFFVGT